MFIPFAPGRLWQSSLLLLFYIACIFSGQRSFFPPCHTCLKGRSAVSSRVGSIMIDIDANNACVIIRLLLFMCRNGYLFGRVHISLCLFVMYDSYRDLFMFNIWAMMSSLACTSYLFAFIYVFDRAFLYLFTKLHSVDSNPSLFATVRLCVKCWHVSSVHNTQPAMHLITNNFIFSLFFRSEIFYD